MLFKLLNGEIQMVIKSYGQSGKVKLVPCSIEKNFHILDISGTHPSTGASDMRLWTKMDVQFRKQSKKNGEQAGIHVQNLLKDIVEFQEDSSVIDKKLKVFVEDIVWDTTTELTGVKTLEK